MFTPAPAVHTVSGWVSLPLKPGTKWYRGYSRDVTGSAAAGGSHLVVLLVAPQRGPPHWPPLRLAIRQRSRDLSADFAGRVSFIDSAVHVSHECLFPAVSFDVNVNVMAASRSRVDKTTYASSLRGDDRRRYEEKLARCGCDPLQLPAAECVYGCSEWPDVDFNDIYEYLVTRTSFLTRQQIKNKKSLEAYNFVVSGWVKEPYVKPVYTDEVIVVGDVNHSQSLSLGPLTAWLLMKADGRVVHGHCLCMAGLGETCSHIAALLFYMQLRLEVEKAKSCTDVSNKWLPAHKRKVVPSPIAEMNFSSAQMRRRQLMSGISSTVQQVPRDKAPPPTTEELNGLFDSLISSGLRPAAAATNPRYSDLYVSATAQCNAAHLLDLYSPSASSFDKPSLTEKCRSITLQITEAAISEIEERTRKQASTPRWFQFRAGRITASNLKAVCTTNVTDPSVSLIKKICYPDNKLNTAAVKYGRNNEAAALESYKSLAAQHHTNVRFSEVGLVVSREEPYFGATPDHLVECECCGKGTVEVKCPYTVRETCLRDLLSQTKSHIVEADGSLVLKEDDEYFYQVQGQMFACNVEYADFVLWKEGEINVERVRRNNTFLENALKKARTFFYNVILLELVGHWFTRMREAAEALQESLED